MQPKVTSCSVRQDTGMPETFRVARHVNCVGGVVDKEQRDASGLCAGEWLRPNLLAGWNRVGQASTGGVRRAVLPHNSPCRKKVSKSWKWGSNCFVENCGSMHAPWIPKGSWSIAMTCWSG